MCHNVTKYKTTYLNQYKNKKDNSYVNIKAKHKSRNKSMRSSVSLKFIIFLKLGVITLTSIHLQTEAAKVHIFMSLKYHWDISTYQELLLCFKERQNQRAINNLQTLEV